MQGSDNLDVLPDHYPRTPTHLVWSRGGWRFVDVCGRGGLCRWAGRRFHLRPSFHVSPARSSLLTAASLSHSSPWTIINIIAHCLSIRCNPGVPLCSTSTRAFRSHSPFHGPFSIGDSGVEVQEKDDKDLSGSTGGSCSQTVHDQ